MIIVNVSCDLKRKVNMFGKYRRTAVHMSCLAMSIKTRETSRKCRKNK